MGLLTAGTLFCLALVLVLAGLDAASKVAGILGVVVALVPLLVMHREEGQPGPGSPDAEGARTPVGAAPGGLADRLGLTRVTARVAGWARTRPVLASSLGLLCVVLLVVGAVMVVQLGSDESSNAGDATTSPAGTSPAASRGAARTWPATIANAPNGTFAYAGPFPATSDRRSVASFFQGDPVNVTCQERNGRLVVDTETGARSTVWNRDDRGWWFSELYLEHSMTGGGGAAQIPAC